MENQEPESPMAGGLQRLGGLTPQSGAVIPMQRPTRSATGGPQPMAPTPSSEIGTLPSERGAAATLPGRWVNQQIGPFKLPEAAVRILTSSLASHLVMMPTSVIATDGQFDGLKVRFQMKPGMPRSAAERDLAVVDGTLRPAAKADVVKHVAVLKARTKSANQDQGEARFAAEVMVGDLAAYPIDVVQFACEYWIDGGREAKWFPSWPELREICERRMQPRRALRKALQWVVDGEPVNAF